MRSLYGKRIAALAIAAVIGVTSFQSAYASRKTDAQNAKAQAESQLNSVNDDITSISQKQAALQKEIDKLDSELVTLLMNMDILADELTDKEAEIVQADKDLMKAKQEVSTQYDRMKKRIRYMYERGDNSLAEAFLGANSMGDLLNQIAYCNQVYDYDRAQLQEFKKAKKQVANLKSRLEDEKAEMEEMQENYKEQEINLNAMVAEKQDTMKNFGTQLQKARQLAAEYKATIEQQNQIIKSEEEKERAAAAAEAARQAAAAAAAEAARQAAAQQAAQQSQSSSGSSTSSSADSTESSASTAPAVSPSGATGSDVVAYAMQFIGNPYVWGGTSLTNGCDCSGFVQSVYAHFGYYLPRTSYEQEHYGLEVSYSQAQPGDLILYSGHVALYIGNGQIVGAQSSRSGITTTYATYRTILTVRRVIY